MDALFCTDRGTHCVSSVSRRPALKLAAGPARPKSPLAHAVAAFEAALAAATPEKPHQQSPLKLKARSSHRDQSGSAGRDPMASQGIGSSVHKDGLLLQQFRSIGVERSAVWDPKSASRPARKASARRAIQNETRGIGPLERGEERPHQPRVHQAKARPGCEAESAQDVGGIREDCRTSSWTWESDECDEVQPDAETWVAWTLPAPPPPRAYSLGVSIKLEAKAMLLRAEMSLPGILSTDTDDDVICQRLMSKKQSLASPWHRRPMPSRHGSWTRSMEAVAPSSPLCSAVHSRSATVGQPQREELFLESRRASSPASCAEHGYVRYASGREEHEHEYVVQRWAHAESLDSARDCSVEPSQAHTQLKGPRAAPQPEPELSDSDACEHVSASWHRGASFAKTTDSTKERHPSPLLSQKTQDETAPHLKGPGLPGTLNLGKPEHLPDVPGKASDGVGDGVLPLAVERKTGHPEGQPVFLKGPSMLLMSARGSKTQASSGAAPEGMLQRLHSVGGSGAHNMGRGGARTCSARRHRASSSSGFAFWHEEAEAYYGPCQAVGTRARLDDSDLEENSVDPPPTASGAPNKHLDRLKRSFCMRRPVGPSSDSCMSRRQLTRLHCPEPEFNTDPAQDEMQDPPSSLCTSYRSSRAVGPDGESSIPAQFCSPECSETSSHDGTQAGHDQCSSVALLCMPFDGAHLLLPSAMDLAPSHPGVGAGGQQPAHLQAHALGVGSLWGEDAAKTKQSSVTVHQTMPRLNSSPVPTSASDNQTLGLRRIDNGRCNGSGQGQRCGHLPPSRSHDSSRFLQGCAGGHAGLAGPGMLAVCRARFKPSLTLEIPDHSE